MTETRVSVTARIDPSSQAYEFQSITEAGLT